MNRWVRLLCGQWAWLLIMELKLIIEAALLSAARPLPLTELENLFDDDERPSQQALRDTLAELALDCAQRPVELKEVASGWRLQVRETFSPWLSRLFEERPGRYSRAFLETLAIIAYRQPTTRGEIEQIRGVAVSSGIIKSMKEREWIHIAGYKDIPGRPALFATTRHFLDYFNLASLSELPPLQEFIERLDASAAEPSSPSPPIVEPTDTDHAHPESKSEAETA
jgi:segregation and condensation protein B